MTTLYEAAYAKVNLTLDVLGKRASPVTNVIWPGRLRKSTAMP